MDKRLHTVVRHHTTDRADREDCEATDAVRSGDADAKSKIIARNEYNIERYSCFLFPHSKTKGLHLRRKLTFRVLRRRQGKKIIKSIEVAPVIGGRAFTNRTYTTLLALIVIWHKNQTQNGKFRVNLSDIARLKRINHESGKNLRNIRDDLYSLRTTIIDFRSTWSASFNEDDLENSLRNFTILADLEIDSKSKYTRDRYVLVEFCQPIVTNLLNRKTNLQNLNSILEISTEIGQILFRYIDTKIYQKEFWQKTSTSLIFRISSGVEGVISGPHGAGRCLEHHLPLLNGRVLSSGKRLYVKLADTADCTDVKIICRTVSDSLDRCGGETRRPSIADEIIEGRTGSNTRCGWRC